MEGEAAACGTQSPLLLVVLGEARQLRELDGNRLYNVFGRNGEGSARERETRHLLLVAAWLLVCCGSTEGPYIGRPSVIKKNESSCFLRVSTGSHVEVS